MKRSLLTLALGLAWLSVFSQWNFVGSAGISNSWSVYNDIETDTTGNPVIIFYQNIDYLAFCLRFDGTQWLQVGGSSFSSFPIGDMIDFKIDNKNNYYILFRNSSDFRLSCIKYNGNIWQYAGSQYISTPGVRSGSIAIDNAGVVYVAFDYYQTDLNIVKENGGSWQTVTINGLKTYPAYPTIAFDKNNIAHIAYSGGSLAKINCARLVNDIWEPVGNSDISSGSYFLSHVKLNITNKKEIYLAFDELNLIRCFKLDSTSNTWKSVGEAGLGGTFSAVDDMTSDINSRIYITTSQMTADKARCFIFNGETWVQLEESGISESYAASVKIAVNKFNTLFATFNDFSISKAIVKQYTISTSSDNFSVDDQIIVYPNPAKDFFIIKPGNFSEMNDYSIKIVSSIGKVAFETKVTQSLYLINSASLTGKGLYIIKVSDGTGRIKAVRKIIIL